MATLNFYYRGKSEKGNLTIKLKHSTNIDYRISTKIVSFRKYWFKANGGKRSLDEFSYLDSNAKQHKAYLENIKEQILIRFQYDLNNGIIISKEWFKQIVNDIVNITLNKSTIEDKQKEKERKECDRQEVEKDIYYNNLLTKAIQRSIEIRYFNTKNQQNRHRQILNKVIAFQKKKQKEFKLKEVNQSFIDEFTKFLMTDLQHKISVTKKYLSNLISSVKYQKASFPEIVELSVGIYELKIIKQSNSDKRRERDEIVITLNFEEIDAIHNLDVPVRLLDAKKCILYGCETAQRVSDFPKLTLENIKETSGIKFWNFWNDKTGKDVIIPITKRIIEYIECYGMPKTQFKSSDDVVLNKQIKEVCRLAGIVEVIETRKQKMIIIQQGNRVRRSVSGKYKKCNVISFHTFRRSFATNYYLSQKLTLSQIRFVTGHSSDAQALEYINESVHYLEQTKQMVNKMNEKKDPQLKVIKNVINE